MSDELYSADLMHPNDFRNYLQHEGVKGMRWGHKKGKDMLDKYANRPHGSDFHAAIRKLQDSEDASVDEEVDDYEDADDSEDNNDRANNHKQFKRNVKKGKQLMDKHKRRNGYTNNIRDKWRLPGR